MEGFEGVGLAPVDSRTFKFEGLSDWSMRVYKPRGVSGVVISIHIDHCTARNGGLQGSNLVLFAILL